jgi:hypothetical protein
MTNTTKALNVAVAALFVLTAACSGSIGSDEDETRASESSQSEAEQRADAVEEMLEQDSLTEDHVQDMRELTDEMSDEQKLAFARSLLSDIEIQFDFSLDAFTSWSDAQLIQLGHDACDAIGALNEVTLPGLNVTAFGLAVEYDMADNEAELSEFGMAYGMLMITFCPETQKRMDDAMVAAGI